VNAILQWEGDTDNGYGAYVPSVYVTNPTAGYNLSFVGTPANWRVINYMSYPTTSSTCGGDDGINPVGFTTFNFNYQGSFSSANVANAQIQVFVLYW
jgi:hypothetical protein